MSYLHTLNQVSSVDEGHFCVCATSLTRRYWNCSRLSHPFLTISLRALLISVKCLRPSLWIQVQQKLQTHIHRDSESLRSKCIYICFGPLNATAFFNDRHWARIDNESGRPIRITYLHMMSRTCSSSEHTINHLISKLTNKLEEIRYWDYPVSRVNKGAK